MSRTSKERETRGNLLEAQILLRGVLTSLQEDSSYCESVEFQGKLEKTIALLKGAIGEAVEKPPTWRDNKEVLVFQIPPRKAYK